MRDAVFQRLPTLIVDRPEYLCDACWKALLAEYPRIAAHYARLLNETLEQEDTPEQPK